MSNVTLRYGADYPLSGILNHFEAYMFLTTPKHYEEHDSFDEEIVLVDGNRDVLYFRMEDLEERKIALKTFNNMLKKKYSDFNSPSHVSCLMIEFMMPEDEWDDNEINESYEELKNILIMWAQNNDRIAAMTQHFYQGRRYPHVHILYQRAPRKHNEFQDYLSNL